MFGLVLDFYWNAASDPVKVSATAATCAAVDAIASINPLNIAGSWARDRIVPVHQKIVTNEQTGQVLWGHVCQIVGS